jgi:hypothetical protein
VVENVMFSNNVVRSSGSGINILGRSAESPTGAYSETYGTQRLNHLTIRNNLIYGIADPYVGSHYMIQSSGALYLTIENNTMFQSGTAFYSLEERGVIVPDYNFVMRNNVMHHGTYGVFCMGYSEGNACMANYTPGGVFTNNIFVGASPTSYNNYSGNQFPATDSLVGFVNLAGGDYGLAASSQYKSMGAGVNCAELNAATGQTFCTP